MTNYYTEDLSDFGYREYLELNGILSAWFDGKGLPEDFEFDGVKPAFNKGSGYVFLTNNEYQVAMLNGDSLEIWHNCPDCGNEGFEEDIRQNPNNCCLFELFGEGEEE